MTVEITVTVDLIKLAEWYDEQGLALAKNKTHYCYGLDEARIAANHFTVAAALRALVKKKPWWRRA